MSGVFTLRQKLKSGEVLLGPWCVIPSAVVMNIIASVGFDYVIVDMEHGVASFETAEEMVRAAHSKGVPAIVRQGTISEENILKSLEIGSDGILSAHVESAGNAREVVALSKYHPIGRRGFSPYTRAGNYSGGDDITCHAPDQNERTLVGVLLEGRKGLESLDEVLEVEHLDLIYIGAYDLSQALGMPGNVGHPKIKEYMEQCIRKIRGAGIAAGGFVAKNREDIKWMVDIGMQFITYLPDCAVIHNAFKVSVDEFNKVVKKTEI